MNIDIRMNVDLPEHPKALKFMKVVGPMGGWMLFLLWRFAAKHKADGILTNITATDICAAIGWKGNPRLMIHALLDCTGGADSMTACPGCDICKKNDPKKRSGWLDKTPSGYRVHDWSDHNPYASRATERSVRAKKGAARRWENKTKQMVSGCLDDNPAYAPAPAPAPAPVPSPIEGAAKISIKGNGSGCSVDAMGRPLKEFK